MMQQDNLLIDQLPKPIKPKISYLGQFGILIGLVGVGVLLAGAIQFAFILPSLGKVRADAKMEQNIMNLLSDPSKADMLRWMQLLSAFAMFFLPVLVSALIISRKAFPYLGFNRLISNKQILYVIGIALLALVASMALGDLNAMLPIPKDWVIKFKAMEELYNKQIMAIARMSNFGEYIFVMVVIALAPAIFEEALFRAGLQQLLTNWTKRPIIAIIVTSFLFSIVHGSFYGFLPRMALGVVLGFIFYYSKNIWLSILMHFLNNGISITAFFYYSQKGKPVKEAMDANISSIYGNIVGLLMGALAIAGLVTLLKYFRNESRKLPAVDTINYLKTDDNPFA
jgi:membrane protease YdiL (CAAX protease family)